MKKATILVLALVLVSALAGIASAKARGYGLVYEVENSRLLDLPARVSP